MLSSKGMRWLRRLAKDWVFPEQRKLHEDPPKKWHLWSIGIYSGSYPYTLKPAHHANNPVLTRSDVTDVCAVFVADPFMLKVRGLWYMFFEIYNHNTDKGEIGLAISRDGFTWNYERIVLAE